MGTYVILGILLLIVAAAIRSSFRHMKGEGGCCGGAGPEQKVKKKKLNQVVGVKTIYIEGMKCENCSRKVENALNSYGNLNAKVNLKENKAVVRLGEPVQEESLKEVVEALGYRVSSIAAE